jgi:hypothetical protein
MVQALAVPRADDALESLAARINGEVDAGDAHARSAIQHYIRAG